MTLRGFWNISVLRADRALSPFSSMTSRWVTVSLSRTFTRPCHLDRGLRIDRPRLTGAPTGARLADRR